MFEQLETIDYVIIAVMLVLLWIAFSNGAVMEHATNVQWNSNQDYDDQIARQKKYIATYEQQIADLTKKIDTVKKQLQSKQAEVSEIYRKLRHSSVTREKAAKLSNHLRDLNNQIFDLSLSQRRLSLNVQSLNLAKKNAEYVMKLYEIRKELAGSPEQETRERLNEELSANYHKQNLLNHDQRINRNEIGIIPYQEKARNLWNKYEKTKDRKFLNQRKAIYKDPNYLRIQAAIHLLRSQRQNAELKHQLTSTKTNLKVTKASLADAKASLTAAQNAAKVAVSVDTESQEVDDIVETAVTRVASEIMNRTNGLDWNQIAVMVGDSVEEYIKRLSSRYEQMDKKQLSQMIGQEAGEITRQVMANIDESVSRMPSTSQVPGEISSVSDSDSMNLSNTDNDDTAQTHTEQPIIHQVVDLSGQPVSGGDLNIYG
jgi:hypothetical protein